MTAKLPPAPPTPGTILVLTRGGTCLHDVFPGSKHTVCGGLAKRIPGSRHLQKLTVCRRCAAYRRRMERK